MGVERRTVVVCDLCLEEANAPEASDVEVGDHVLPDGWSLLMVSRFDIENDIICEGCSEALLEVIRRRRAKGGLLPKFAPPYAPGFGPTNGGTRLSTDGAEVAELCGGAETVIAEEESDGEDPA